MTNNVHNADAVKDEDGSRGAHALRAPSDHAPRPRAGFRSQSEPVSFDRAQLFAGVLRASLGAVGVFGALLYLPVQPVTPVLAGVSILMMVTGTTSTWRAVALHPPLRKVPAVVAACCVATTVVAMALTWVLGAGALGPVAAARAAASEARRTAPASIRFDAVP